MPPKAASTQVIEVIVPFKKADAQVMPVMSINFPETQQWWKSHFVRAI